MCQGIKIAYEKISILKIAQKPEIYGGRSDQKKFCSSPAPVFFYEQAENIACQDCKYHQKYITEFAPCIE